jgi:hypothetical protein
MISIPRRRLLAAGLLIPLEGLAQTCGEFGVKKGPSV